VNLESNIVHNHSNDFYEVTPKREWFTVDEVIEKLNKIRHSSNFSYIDIIEFATKTIHKEKYPNRHFASFDNLPVYAHFESPIKAKIVGHIDDNLKGLDCFDYIVVSGYIPLQNEYLNQFRISQTILVKDFCLPDTIEAKKKGLWSLYQTETNFNGGACIYFVRINKQYRKLIDYENFGELLIHRVDLAYLLLKLKTTLKNISKSPPHAEKNKKKPRRYQLSNYKMAAANFLALEIWKNYPNILAYDLAKYDLFTVIHCYKFGEYTQNDYHSKEIVSKLGKTSDTALKTIIGWISLSVSDHLAIKARPPSNLKMKSLEEFKLLEEDKNAFKLIKRIIGSIEFYNKQNEKPVDFEGRIDLEEIISELKNKNPRKQLIPKTVSASNASTDRRLPVLNNQILLLCKTQTNRS
jgi:hypothetical protein